MKGPVETNMITCVHGGPDAEAWLEMAIGTGTTDLPNDWDRSGLPAWTYQSAELLELEKERVFRRNWLCVGHVSEIPQPGDYLSFDAADERALIVRGRDGEIRAFHTLCRHRGSRVATERRYQRIGERKQHEQNDRRACNAERELPDLTHVHHG